MDHRGLWLPPGPDDGGCAWWSDRTAITLALFLGLTVGWALLRADAGYADAPKWYWIDKLTWGPDAAAIVAGDSRVYRGVDPDPVQQQLGGVARNFGFSSVFISSQYLRRAQALLDPRGPRVLIIGVTAASLRRPLPAGDGFTQATLELARLRLPVRLARRVAEWDQSLRPIAIDLAAGGGGMRASAAEYLQDYHDNGWIESSRVVPDPIANGIMVTQQDFAQSPHHEPALAQLLEEIAALSSSGVRVIVFVPPVLPEVSAAEFSLGSFDAAELRRACESRGALWADIPMQGLRSYDGSHLDGPSAHAVGEALARVVMEATSPRHAPAD